MPRTKDDVRKPASGARHDNSGDSLGSHKPELTLISLRIEVGQLAKLRTESFRLRMSQADLIRLGIDAALEWAHEQADRRHG